MRKQQSVQHLHPGPSQLVKAAVVGSLTVCTGPAAALACSEERRASRRPAAERAPLRELLLRHALPRPPV